MDTDSQLYKLSIWSSIKPFIWPFFVTLVFIVGFIPIIVFTANTDSQTFALIVAIVWITFTGVPPIVLEINYIMYDWNTSFEIDQSNGIVKFSKQGRSYSFRIQDIVQIEKYHSNIVKGETMARMHWHTFYYYKLVLRQHEPITLSRMIVERLEKKIENVKTESIRKSFPIIRR